MPVGDDDIDTTREIGKEESDQRTHNIPFAGCRATCHAPQSSPRPIGCCAEGRGCGGVVWRGCDGAHVEGVSRKSMRSSSLHHTKAVNPIPPHPTGSSYVPSSTLLVLVVVAHLALRMLLLLLLTLESRSRKEGIGGR